MITIEEQTFYQRQLGIPSWGIEAQERLKSASVFVAGAGGLGGALLYYCAAAGIGTLSFCDSDVVEESNLNRQILHNMDRIGIPKVESAVQTLSRLNPHIKLVPIHDRLTVRNAEVLVANASVIVDCLDNFPSRMILNGVAVKRGIPFVHGGVEGMRGQVTFFHPPRTACLACIIPARNDRKKISIVGSCAGVVGSLQAMEVIKYITGIGTNLLDRILFWDGADMKYDTMMISKNPRCPVCG